MFETTQTIDLRTAPNLTSLFAHVGPRARVEMTAKGKTRSWYVIDADAAKMTFTAKSGGSTRTFVGAETQRGCVLMSYTPRGTGDAVSKVAF